MNDFSTCIELSDMMMRVLAIQGVPKNLLESGEQCIVSSPFNFVFPGV